MFEADALDDALKLLGALLRDRGERFEVVAIGGGGLQLLGFIQRPTKDIDLVALRDGDALHPAARPLPPTLAQAIADVALLQGLDEQWMNGGPTSLLQFGLPDGFLDRLEHRSYDTLGVWLASRFDQIHFKLYAAADDRPNGKHHGDLQKLSPTRDELIAAARWAQTHDPSEGFAVMVAGVLRSFGVES
ncbi:MAG TPA: DUF6036 family nucleotidyltransferase [Kofleriaceae bacterium]|jgi:hypothetical protein